MEWHYIAPGKPMQNGFCESFNGRMTATRSCVEDRRAAHTANFETEGSPLKKDLIVEIRYVCPIVRVQSSGEVHATRLTGEGRLAMHISCLDQDLLGRETYFECDRGPQILRCGGS